MSDPTGFDEQTVVDVDDEARLSAVVHEAIDEMLERHRDGIAFPVFIDIHPRNNFKGHEWMYKEESNRGVAPNRLPTRP